MVLFFEATLLKFAGHGLLYCNNILVVNIISIFLLSSLFQELMWIESTSMDLAWMFTQELKVTEDLVG